VKKCFRCSRFCAIPAQKFTGKIFWGIRETLRYEQGKAANQTSDRSTYRGVAYGTDSWSLGTIPSVRELTAQAFLYEGFDENESRDG
jgi:hypothetical protein